MNNASVVKGPYLGQIERYCRERSREHLVEPDLFGSANPHDPPF